MSEHRATVRWEQAGGPFAKRQYSRAHSWSFDGGVTVPAGSHAHLSPGGDHIMLMSLKHPLTPGDEVPLTLKFSDNTTHDLKVPVKAFTEEEEHYHPTPR